MTTIDTLPTKDLSLCHIRFIENIEMLKTISLSFTSDRATPHQRCALRATRCALLCSASEPRLRLMTQSSHNTTVIDVAPLHFNAATLITAQTARGARTYIARQAKLQARRRRLRKISRESVSTVSRQRHGSHGRNEPTPTE